MALRQRLESLRRAGVDRVALPLIEARPRTTAERAEPVARTVVTEQPKTATPPPAPPLPPIPAEPAVRPEPVKPARVPTPAPLIGSLFEQDLAQTPTVPASERPALLAALQAEVATCTRCPLLASTRTQTVFGVGSPTARLMFVGEAPGADEDRQGIPFVGRAGMLLTDMITKGMGLTREEVYIANILKSRPPENRNPEPDEIAHCLPFLERQIEIIRPEFLCLLGKISASTLLNTALPLARLRGRWHRYQGIATIVTYHPAYLLRNPADKKKAWEDLQMLMKAMGITPPNRRGASN
ncbi:MAG: uracil-DNA glycosylase [Isosphaeraceae bacterium]